MGTPSSEDTHYTTGKPWETDAIQQTSYQQVLPNFGQVLPNTQIPFHRHFQHR
jgi:hypothetical protein